MERQSEQIDRRDFLNTTETETVQDITNSACVHHWIIETPQGQTSRGD